MKGHLLSKVVFSQRSSSVKDRLLSGIGIGISFGMDSFLHSFYSLKLTGNEKQADMQVDRRADKPVYWEAAPPKMNKVVNKIMNKSWEGVLGWLD